VLRKWVKEFGSDPVQAFPGYGQMLKAERDILKKAAAYFAKEVT
jgi:transposase